MLIPLAQTGVPGLDHVLQGGLPAGHLYLIEGDPGAGKTTLSLQFLMEGVRRGEKSLYITLSESTEEIKKVAVSHGWDLSGVQIAEMGQGIAEQAVEDQYTVFRPSDVELGATAKQIVDLVKVSRANRVVLDSLSELRLLADEPLRFRRQILRLKHLFSAGNTTVLMLDDRTVAYEQQPQSIAHGVIELNCVANTYGAERRRLRIVKLRGHCFRGGYHDFTIATGGVVVFPRVLSPAADAAGAAAAAAVSPLEDRSPANSGMEGFDDLLGGGLNRGTSTLIIGPAGTGKSSLAMKIADMACNRGERVSVFAFEENQRIVSQRTNALGMGIADHIRAGLLVFKHVMPAELSPGEFGDQIRAEVEERGSRMILIDSLNGYMNSMPEEGFLTAQLHEVLSYLNGRGVVTVMVLAQRGMMGPTMTVPVDVSYLADTVVMLRYFEAFGAVRKAISVVKKRTGRHEETIRELRFEDGSLQVGKVLSEFRGVLTGVPVYVGSESALDGKEARHDGPV